MNEQTISFIEDILIKIRDGVEVDQGDAVMGLIYLAEFRNIQRRSYNQEELKRFKIGNWPDDTD